MYLKELEHCLIRVFKLFKAVCGGAQKHEPGFVNKGVAYLPCGILSYLLPQEHIQIFHNKQKPFALFIGKIHNLGQGAVTKP